MEASPGGFGRQRELTVEPELERLVKCLPSEEEEESVEIQEKGWEQYVPRHKGDRTSNIFKGMQGSENVCRLTY